MTIKNGDLPAMPITTDEAICQMTGTTKPEFSGLTKREQFAAMAMQGLLSNSFQGPHRDYKPLAIESITYADALLAELERTK